MGDRGGAPRGAANAAATPRRPDATYQDVPCQICERLSWEILVNNTGPSVCSGGEIVQNAIPLVKGMCTNCGFVYTLSSPLDADLDHYYKSEYSAKLEDDESDYFNFSTNSSFGETLNRFVLAYEFPRSGRFLDIGCGKGFFEEAFVAKHPDWQIEGVDPSVRSIELAAKRNPTVTFYTKKFEVGDYRPGRYDAVAIHTVLNRVPAGAFLAEAVSLLKPGGIMSIEVALFSATPFQLYFADHTCQYYREHFLYLASKNGLTLEREDLRGSLARFIFKRQPGRAPGTADVSASTEAIKQQSRDVARAWDRLFSDVRQLIDGKKRVSFYGAGTSCGILLAMTKFPASQIAGIYDDTPTKVGRLFNGLPIRPLSAQIRESDAIVLCAGFAGIEIMKAKVGSHSGLIFLRKPA